MITIPISKFVPSICLLASCAYAVTEKGSEKANSETIKLLAEKTDIVWAKLVLDVYFFKCLVAEKEFDVKSTRKMRDFFQL